VAGYEGNIVITSEFNGAGVTRAAAQIKALNAAMAQQNASMAAMGRKTPGGALSQWVHKNQLGLRMFGHDAQMVGQTIFRWITIPLGVVSVVAAKMAYDFNTAMTKIQALTGASTKDMKKYNEAVLELSKTTGVMPTDVAEGLYFIASSGFKGAAALKILNQAVKLSAAGMGEMRWVSETLTSAMTAWGRNTLTAASAADTLVAAVREGKAEPDEFARSLGRVIPVASQIGIKFAEVGAAIASVTRIGMSARISTFGLRTLLTSFTKPQKPLIEGLKAIGMTVNEVYRNMTQKGFLPAMREIYEKTNGSAKKITRMFTQNGATIFLALMRDYKGTQGVFDRLLNRHGDAQRAFLVAMKSPAAKFRVALAGLAAAAIELGAKLLPIFTRIVGWVKGVADWFNGLSTGTQVFIGKTLLAAAAVGVLLSALGKIATVMTGTAAMKLMLGGEGQVGIFSKIFGGSKAAAIALETTALEAQAVALGADIVAAQGAAAAQLELAASMQASAAATAEATAALRAEAVAALPTTPAVAGLRTSRVRVAPIVATGAYNSALFRRAAVDISSALIPVYKAEKATVASVGRIRAAFSTMGKGIVTGLSAAATGAGSALKSVGRGILSIVGSIAGALGPMGLFAVAFGTIAAASIAAHAIFDKTIADARTMAHAMEVVQADTSGAVQKWADKALGGHLVIKKGKLTWKPAVDADIALPNVSRLTKWVATTGAETRKQIAIEAAKSKLDIAKSGAQIAQDSARAAELAYETIKKTTKGADLSGTPLGAHVAALRRQAVEQRRIYEELAGDAERLQKRLDGINKKYKPIIIKARIEDMTAAKNKLEGQLKSINAQLKKTTGKKHLDLELKKTNILEKMKALGLNIKDITSRNWKILITARIEKTQKDLATAEKTLKRVTKEAKGKVTIEVTLAQKRVDFLERKRANLIAKRDKLQIDANPNPALRGISAVTRALGLFMALPSTKTITVTTRKIALSGPPPKAEGGIFNSPTVVLVGEAGPEVIIPLTRHARAAQLMAQSGLGVQQAARAATSSNTVSPTGTNANALRAGAKVATDFANGIKSKQQKVIEAAASLATNVLSVLESALGIGAAISSLKEQGLPSTKVATLWAKKVSVRLKAMIKVMQAAFRSIDIGKAIKGDKDGFGAKEQGWKAEAFASVVSMAEGIGSIFTTFAELTVEKVNLAIAAINRVKTKAKTVANAVKSMVKAFLTSFNKTSVSEFKSGNITRGIELANALAGVITTFAELTAEKIDDAVANLQYIFNDTKTTRLYDLVTTVHAFAVYIVGIFKAMEIKETVSTAASASMQMTNDLAGVITTFAELTAKKIDDAIANLKFLLTGGRLIDLRNWIYVIAQQLASIFKFSSVTDVIASAASSSVQMVNDLAGIITTFSTLTMVTVGNAIKGLGFVVGALPSLKPAILALVTGLGNTFKDIKVSPELAAASTAASQLVGEITGIISSLMEMTEIAIENGIRGAGWLAVKAEALGDALWNMLGWLNYALGGLDVEAYAALQIALDKLNEIATAIAGIVNSLADITEDKIAAANKAGTALGQGFLTGLASMYGEIIGMATKIAADAAAALGSGGGGGGAVTPPGGDLLGKLAYKEGGGVHQTVSITVDKLVAATPQQGAAVATEVATQIITRLATAHQQTSRGVA